MEELNNEFSKKQIKWINRISVFACLIYEVFAVMAEINTDYTDGIFMLYPLFLLICVGAKSGFLAYLPRILMNMWFLIVQIVGIFAQWNVIKEGNWYKSNTEELVSSVKTEFFDGNMYLFMLQYMIKILPVLILFIAIFIFIKKIKINKLNPILLNPLVMLGSAVLVIALTLGGELLLNSINKFLVYNFKDDSFTTYTFDSVNVFGPLFYSLIGAAVFFTGLTALFFKFKNKICKGNEE